MPDTQKPILIIGAGISGLTFAQACRKQGLPYQVFEKDDSLEHRGAGWGLTLNWALPAFRALLPDDIVEHLSDAYVNKEAIDAGERGNFTFFDLSTGESKWKVPASERIRVSRLRLRKVLLREIDVQWSKALASVNTSASGVTATFSDGKTVTGCLLIGCDGANSQVRRLCHPSDHSNRQLPVRMIGTGVHYTHAQIKAIRELDPYFLQGSDPRTNVFFWFSFLNTPADPNSGEGSSEKYYCQIMTSWPAREGFLGRTAVSEAPEDPADRLAWMKMLSEKWSEPFRSVVHEIANDSITRPVHLIDWLPRRTAAFGGKVILIGDAAHPMVMYRGEGANHAIVDVAELLENVAPFVRGFDTNESNLSAAVEKFELEMIERTELAVLASRQACLDAHDWPRLNDDSPLVRRRVMRGEFDVSEHVGGGQSESI